MPPLLPSLYLVKSAIPPVIKSGSKVNFLFLRYLIEASMSSIKLCDKILVERPTAIPSAPWANNKGNFTGKLIKELNNSNVKLNITAVYTSLQTKKILRLINKKTKVIISIFAGRAGDSGKDPLPQIINSIKISKKFKNVEILWASVREPYNYLQANQIGCHLITIPPSIIEKIEKFGKSFDQLTKETVKAFLFDSKKSKFKI